MDWKIEIWREELEYGYHKDNRLQGWYAFIVLFLTTSCEIMLQSILS